MEYVKTICKIGQGALCCRYLTVGRNGFNCEKHTALKNVLDARIEVMVAKGDNCEGVPGGVDLSEHTVTPKNPTKKMTKEFKESLWCKVSMVLSWTCTDNIAQEEPTRIGRFFSRWLEWEPKTVMIVTVNITMKEKNPFGPKDIVRSQAGDLYTVVHAADMALCLSYTRRRVKSIEMPGMLMLYSRNGIKNQGPFITF